MSNLLELSGQQFLDQLASSLPAPGGGSAAAQAIATAAALLEMVAKLTLGKKKDRTVQQDMEDMLAEAEQLGSRARSLVTEDTEAYQAVMEAYQLPKATDEEKLVRKQAILNASKQAILVPQETANVGVKTLKLAQISLAKGNINAFSDGLVACYLASAGCKGALANVKINLPSLKDQQEVEQYQKYCMETIEECDRLIMQAEIRSKAQLG